MPVYEFICPECQVEEERVLPFDHGCQKCSKCGAPLKKLISLTSGFISKGFTDAHKETKAKALRRRNRAHFVNKGRDEAIARGGKEWKAGTTIEDVKKAYPGTQANTPESQQG